MYDSDSYHIGAILSLFIRCDKPCWETTAVMKWKCATCCRFIQNSSQRRLCPGQHKCCLKIQMDSMYICQDCYNVVHHHMNPSRKIEQRVQQYTNASSLDALLTAAHADVTDVSSISSISTDNTNADMIASEVISSSSSLSLPSSQHPDYYTGLKVPSHKVHLLSQPVSIYIRPDNLKTSTILLIPLMMMRR